jgi:hypothetical protein
VFSGNTAQHLMNVLAECSHDDTVRIFAGILRLWLECIAVQIENDAIARDLDVKDYSGLGKEQFVEVESYGEILIQQCFYNQSKANLWDKIVDVEAAFIRVVQFATRAAQQGNIIRLAMLDAGILVLVLAAFANSHFKLTGLVNMLTQEEKMKVKATKSGRDTNIDPASAPLPLPVVTMNAGASTLLVLMRFPTFRQFWGEHRFNTRLSLCGLLVDSLFGDDGNDGGSRETRNLFKEIVGR